MLMSEARPILREAAQSRMAVQRAPDCDTTDMTPLSGVWLAKEAFML